MLVLAVLSVALVSSVLTGGRLEYARNWQLKGLWMALGAFAVQTALFTQWGTGFVGETLVPVVYVVTLSALVVFLVTNRRVLGVPILLAGLIAQHACCQCQCWTDACFRGGTCWSGPRRGGGSAAPA